MDHPSLTSHEFFGPNGLPEIFHWFLWLPHFILQAPSVPKRTVELCVHMLDIFWVSHLFLRSVRRQKNSPNKCSQKIHESMPQIFGGTNLENFHFNRADVHCYGVGIWPCCSGDICWESPSVCQPEGGVFWAMALEVLPRAVLSQV